MQEAIFDHETNSSLQKVRYTSGQLLQKFLLVLFACPLQEPVWKEGCIGEYTQVSIKMTEQTMKFQEAVTPKNNSS